MCCCGKAKTYQLVERVAPNTGISRLYQSDYARDGSKNEALSLLNRILLLSEQECGKDNVRTPEEGYQKHELVIIKRVPWSSGMTTHCGYINSVLAPVRFRVAPFFFFPLDHPSIFRFS
ncbi:hypothetical protein VN97_g3200 [Penicillium thymicola]|uniref:Uncharacterized protein n=1 Tax=Penicillium thymicola TaxID=293382 RepID=A0AAI9TMQ5_PENTH|nr:hypothetical protein VN97_g3200 [Penicillium thymicola]